MANRRKPPRKSAGKKQESSHKHPGGNRGQQQHKKRPDHGRSNRHQQQTVATKISETMKELPMRSAQPSGGSSTWVKIIGFIAVALILFFGYFIVREYLDKTPVYGKHGWDESAGEAVTWEDAVKYCSSRRKRLPDKEELKSFSKRADKKLKSAGVFWSTSPSDKGDYTTVNLSTGEYGSSETSHKFAAICVK
ncbi:DUF1566 domain-containing protein [Leptospira langatensis]|uniref:DUF1566 domain-containing protein n=1 Tax=Leptospira langatensis TaxID=2484983 RepID=A0A5F1ZUX8_9LEPT|nr:DUF1566 domain-containing protein [Leptospira langatensis]TGK02884.1 DUF1566 domain-containing protein [Leptospira langatensis]TGL41638.1 DUF1566 domain-containing protein [Leptospira langatensis]